MTLPERFQPGAPNYILAESVDEELLVVNLVSGAYYASFGPGDAAFFLLAAGHTADETAVRIAEHYSVGLDEVRAQLQPFVEAIVADNLLDPREAGLAAEPFAFTHTKPWSPIELARYTDMEELLAADPVHDVDAAGWPAFKRE